MKPATAAGWPRLFTEKYKNAMARILIVDDQSSNRQAVAVRLGGAGHSVAEAGGETDAFAAVRASRPDLAVVDAAMSTRGHREFVEQFCGDLALAGVPLILYTAAAHLQAARQLAITHGDLVVLADPLEPGAVLVAAEQKLRAQERGHDHSVAAAVDADGDEPPRQAPPELEARVVERTRQLLDEIAERKQTEAGQQRLNRALRLLSRCNMMLVRARNEKQLLDDLCRLVVESGGYLMSWVGVAEQDDEKSVRPIAQFACPESFLAGQHFSWNGSRDIGRGPMGTALRIGRTEAEQDCLTSPRMAPWREAALACGFRSCVALPLCCSEQVLGALILYSAEPDAFGAYEIKLLEELAGNMAFGIESLRAHAELERYREQLEQRVAERTQEIVALNAELVERVKEAELANSAKNVFIATLSHEIRTPLNAVVGLTGLLTDSPLNRRQRDYADKILLSTRALRALIDNILDFSKIEAGALRLEQTPFSLNAVLRTLAAVVSVGMRDKPIEALFDVAPDIPDALIGDALRLQQILLNLIGNAVKFTAAGVIVLSVRRVGEAGERGENAEAGESLVSGEGQPLRLQFAVRDTGIGISPEHLDQIFEAFAQADSSICRRYGGSGLGLAISARLADLMGGSIEVDSQVGSGSEFRFTVPLATADGDSVASREAAAAVGLSDLNILIVDDHPLGRDIIAAACAAFGWKTTACGSALAALLEMRQSVSAGRHYDLLLLDWRMPGMNGLEMLRRIHAEAGIGLPLVILMAATFELENAIAASEDVHIDGTVAKPLTPASLFEAVRRVLTGEGGVLDRLDDLVPDPGMPDRRLAGLRLLVAEDNELNQQVIEATLSRCGAEVVIAGNGRIAVDILRPGPRFDAVLMDIQMPVMDGYAATRAIRQELGLTQLPIFAVTAHAAPADREESRLAGMNGHLVKPIEVDELVDLIGRSRGRPQRRPPAPQPAPSLAAGDPPELAVANGLKAFAGDVAKYRATLLRFIELHGEDVTEARSLFVAGKRDGATRLIHDLRGVAGFLQAPVVARLAAATEDALRHGHAADVVLPLLAELQEAMHALTAAIDRISVPASS
jgi:signal transduction histidine kinase/DNA-binding response OmpR family regulator